MVTNNTQACLSSRLLNRQVKYVMHILQQEICKDVLEGLEKSFKSQAKRDSWGVSFCVLLVLCMCIEELQSAADTFVSCDMLKEGKNSLYNRNQSAEACAALEEYPYQQCTRLFHDVYRSQRAGMGGPSRESVFNPFRDLKDGNDSGLDKTTNELASKIYDMVSCSCEFPKKISVAQNWG